VLRSFGASEWNCEQFLHTASTQEWQPVNVVCPCNSGLFSVERFVTQARNIS
jgi:hypothetical protein